MEFAFSLFLLMLGFCAVFKTITSCGYEITIGVHKPQPDQVFYRYDDDDDGDFDSFVPGFDDEPGYQHDYGPNEGLGVKHWYKWRCN